MITELATRVTAPREKLASTLGAYFRLERRYTRAVNLERDLEVSGSLDGYVLTERAIELVERMLGAQARAHPVRAWTVTGVYGTGKSACAHFVASLFGPRHNPGRRRALEILKAQPLATQLSVKFGKSLPERGFVRAVATATREPITHALIRALARGAETFWEGRTGRKPLVLNRLRDLRDVVSTGGSVPPDEIPRLVRQLVDAAQTGLLIIIDELGKALEHVAHDPAAHDLYLLQQLAELRAGPHDPPVLLLGLLHQAFTEYGHGLSQVERAEWDKIQGRFEDMVFVQSPEQTLRLVSEAIKPSPPQSLTLAVRTSGEAWHAHLSSAVRHPYITEVLSSERIAAVYPLHPIAALVLPTLCAKYAQNDRSLFTFLTSSEPHSLSRFLEETAVDLRSLPLLKLPEVYDYFIDGAGIALSARPQFRRWSEVHSVIRDAVGLAPDELAALKVIGTLNLVTSSGPMRASRAMVLSALMDKPRDRRAWERWSAVVDRLTGMRLVTHRQQVDEFRIWEGSDYDLDAALRIRLENERRSLAELLNETAALTPVVAERHSYRTGTLRFFERHYIDNSEALTRIRAHASDSDGVIAYWVGDNEPTQVPPAAADGKPLVVVARAPVGALRQAASIYASLSALDHDDASLQTDGVARREVRERLAIAREALDECVRNAFIPAVSGEEKQQVWVAGAPRRLARLNTVLSEVCENVYHASPVLWNELLNRRDLTSQGAKARRELIEALITRHEHPRLGLTGNGPEVSMYNSILLKTGIHRAGDTGTWIIGPPTTESVRAVWEAIQEFCMGAASDARSIDQLYGVLAAPPYGVKQGIVPVLLTAVLLHHSDDVTLYQEGTFVPILGPEHLELLARDPNRFAVKHFSLAGIRLEVFRELELIIAGSRSALPAGVRNPTLLNVVRPLVRFAKSLPAVTRQTHQLSQPAIAVREALLSATEPDRLIFDSLPTACGLEPFLPDVSVPDPQRVAAFRKALQHCLGELRVNYERLIDSCAMRVHGAFGVPADVMNFREHLRVRAQYLVSQVVERRLRSLMNAAVDQTPDYRQWLTALLMIIADKPVDAWSDDDLVKFEVNLGDLSRRFANLEALQKEVARDRCEGFDARRVTITVPNGEERHCLVWLPRTDHEIVERQTERLVDSLRGIENEQQRQAVAVALVERLLGLEPTTQGEEVTHLGQSRSTPVAPKVKGRRRHG